jgi:chromosome segregation ATPase
MSDEGYFQTKLAKAEDTIKELQNTIKVLKMNYDSLDRRLLNIEPEIKKIFNLDSTMNKLKKELELKNNESIKKEIVSFREAIGKEVSISIDEKLKDKLKEYDTVCEKTMRVTTGLIDNWNKQNYMFKYNDLKHKVESICNILISKKICSTRELEQAFNSYHKRNKNEVIE